MDYYLWIITYGFFSVCKLDLFTEKLVGNVLPLKKQERREAISIGQPYGGRYCNK